MYPYQKLKFFLFVCIIPFLPKQSFSSDCAIDLGELLTISKRQEPKIIIVDAYSSGSLLANAFKDRDVIPIHLQSSKEINPALKPTYKPQDFSYNIPYQAEIDVWMAALKILEPIAIIAGTESGVLLANKLSTSLSEELQLPTNRGVKGLDNPFMVFRDKYLMHEALSKADPKIRHLKQFASNSAESIIHWVNENNFFTMGTKKIVIKPRGSAGSEAIFICTSEQDIKHAVEHINSLGKSIFDLDTSKIVAQEYIQGTEYVVNAVSQRGSHLITDIWQYTKRVPESGGGVLYDHDILLPYKGEAQDQLTPYIIRVLNTLGLRFGFSHSEVFIDDKGPVLVETANRLMGCCHPALSEKAIRNGPLQLGVEAIAFSDQFFRRQPGYILDKHILIVELSSNSSGKYINLEFAENFKQLPGYYKHGFDVDTAKPTEISTDLSNTLGKVWLIDSSPTILLESLNQIRKWERNGDFFRD